MCNCKQTTLDELKDHCKKNLPEHRPETLKVEFENTAFRFDQNPNDLTLPVRMTFRQIKKDGSVRDRDTTKKISMFMSYCPFCGEKYPESAKKT